MAIVSCLSIQRIGGVNDGVTDEECCCRRWTTGGSLLVTVRNQWKDADWICQAVVDAKEAKRWVAIVGLMTWRIDQRYLFRNCETGLEQTVGFV